jgi:hypothetical protein
VTTVRLHRLRCTLAVASNFPQLAWPGPTAARSPQQQSRSVKGLAKAWHGRSVRSGQGQRAPGGHFYGYAHAFDFQPPKGLWDVFCSSTPSAVTALLRTKERRTKHEATKYRPQQPFRGCGTELDKVKDTMSILSTSPDGAHCPCPASAVKWPGEKGVSYDFNDPECRYPRTPH